MSIIKLLAPIPKIEKSKVALFVGPHPDDIEIGAGGLVNKLIRNGCIVYYLICTDGGSGILDKSASSVELVKTRIEEARKAGELLGVKEVMFLDYPDGGKYSVDDLRVDIAKIVMKVKPDLLVCPSPHLKTETHIDHLRVAKAASTCLLLATFPLVSIRQGINMDEYESLTKGVTLAYYFSSDINQIVRIKKIDLEKKISALECHKSQMDEGMNDVKRYIKFKAKMFGLKRFARFGEGYFVLGPVHQHCFGENI